MTLDYFIAQLEQKGYSARTVREYRKWARRLITWCRQRDIHLEDVTAGELRQWSQTLPSTWASRKQAHTAVKHLLGALGRVDEPWHAIRVPRKPRPRYRGLELHQASDVHQAAHMIGGRHGTSVLLMLYTGARVGEVAGMRWCDIDLEAGWISWWKTKTSEWHELPLAPTLAEALRAYQYLGAWSVYLFPGGPGRPHVAAQTVWEWVGYVGRLAGIDGLRPHQLRATAGALVLEATADLDAAAELLDHRDVSVTRAHYTFTSRRRLQGAVDAIDDQLAGGEVA
jgi:integrase